MPKPLKGKLELFTKNFLFPEIKSFCEILDYSELRGSQGLSFGGYTRYMCYFWEILWFFCQIDIFSLQILEKYSKITDLAKTSSKTWKNQFPGVLDRFGAPDMMWAMCHAWPVRVLSWYWSSVAENQFKLIFVKFVFDRKRARFRSKPNPSMPNRITQKLKLGVIEHWN